MKTIARFLFAAAALGAAGLITGCVNTRSKVVKVMPMSFEIKVVDSSSSRMLPPEELNILKANLVRYLADQGEIVQGHRYYLRVDFAPDKSGEPGEWLLVELLSPLDNASYSTVASYRGSSPYYYPDYIRPGYSTHYSSYQDPFDYNYGGAYWPNSVVPPRGNNPRDHAPGGNRGGNRDGNRDWNRNNRPGDRNDHQPGNYAGGDGRGRDRDDDHRSRPGDNNPRSDDSDRGRGRDSDHSAPTTARVSDNSGGNSGGGSSYTPPPAPSYSPPPEPARSESNSGIQKDSAQREEN